MSTPETQLTDLHLERLVLIVDSNEAQRLVATWYMVWERYGDRLENPDDVGEALAEEFLAQWSKVSAVDIDDVMSLVPVLFENELLVAEGQVAPEALRFIQSRMLDLLQKPPR